MRILPGALTLALASRAPPRLSWSTTFKRGLTVVRGLGNFVFMKNHLVPVKSWKPVFKRRNSATLKKGHSIQVIINRTLQKCKHCPAVVKKTQIVFPPAPNRQTQSAACTSTVAIIPTQYHEPPPNARPHYACGRPLSHEQCKEGKIQQNSECFFVFTLLYQLAYPLCASRAPIPTPIPLILPLVWIVIILLLRSLRAPHHRQHPHPPTSRSPTSYLRFPAALFLR